MRIDKQKQELAIQLLFEKTKYLVDQRKKATESYGVDSFVTKTYNEFLKHLRKDVISKADLDDEFFEFVFGHVPRCP